MEFRNPENGYVEKKSVPWLWCFFFGPFYFMVSGAGMHAAIMLIVTVLLYASLGPPATILVFFMNMFYCMFANSIIRNMYLRKGWEVVGEQPTQVTRQPVTNPAPTQAASPETKKCPFCAEEVKFEAIKCKHCGSDLSVSPSPASVPLN